LRKGCCLQEVKMGDKETGEDREIKKRTGDIYIKKRGEAR
jgi:hypothetical protein